VHFWHADTFLFHHRKGTTREIYIWRMISKAYILVFLLFIVSCSHRVTVAGKASYYADKFEGRRTSNGEIFKQRKKTAAHRTLPFGTLVTVKNLANGRTVKVRVNDRGPFVQGRTIDLSKKAAKKLDMVNAGVASVELKYKGQSR
jgi:rare lipoprotein A